MTFRERLAACAKERADIEQQLEALYCQRDHELATLHKKLGYESVAALIAALRGKKKRIKPREGSSTKPSVANPTRIVTYDTPKAETIQSSEPAALPEDDLSLPKAFRLLPPWSEIEITSIESKETHISRLVGLRTKTNEVLHTSGVIAPIWREWRAFERRLQEELGLKS